MKTMLKNIFHKRRSAPEQPKTLPHTAAAQSKVSKTLPTFPHHIKNPQTVRKLILRDGTTWTFQRPYLMGIINITPDSFYDGGKYLSTSQVLKLAERMLLFGVDVIDLGGESSRPGATPVSYEEEYRRVIPKLKKLKKRYPLARISIDTRKVKIAAAAIAAGADIINDISAGDDSANAMLELAAHTQTPIILMHKRGTPQTMQENPVYADVTTAVYTYFEHKLAALAKLNLNAHKTIIDVGIGFGKTVDHNVTLIKNLEKFRHLKQPILVGASMKSLITHLTTCSPQERLAGTLGIQLASLVKGADMIRVHDVKAARYSIETFFPALG